MGGTYRIDDQDFPAPDSTNWEESPIADGLNVIPILSSYRVHTWNWSEMDGCDFERLIDLFDEQQDGNAQLGVLETDPYGVTLSDAKYGTTEYADFVIVSLSPRVRGLPHYGNVSVSFEVYVA
jgi:hypothetical protein